MDTKFDIGMKAPDFELPGTKDAKVRLYDQLVSGPVVLLFYPLDWSPVCTNELCSIRDGFHEFEGLGVKVFGISVDSIFSHRAFAESLKISFQLLSDFNKEVCKAYDAFHAEIMGLKGIAKRAVFLLDKAAVFRYIWISDDPGIMPDIQKLKEQINKING